MMKHRASLINNEVSNLAEAMYDDLSFPKQSEDYDEISSYLELSGLLDSMSIFDEAWELYIQER
ncbi:hypothetical protein bcere0022_18630 [Bacillus cereus Rock3-44]|nr:hypothetical protein bcere0022_18630 [Bacillus cereus Rock3-44]